MVTVSDPSSSDIPSQLESVSVPQFLGCCEMGAGLMVIAKHLNALECIHSRVRTYSTCCGVNPASNCNGTYTYVHYTPHNCRYVCTYIHL